VCSRNLKNEEAKTRKWVVKASERRRKKPPDRLWEPTQLPVNEYR
jgi:hypothetical protein